MNLERRVWIASVLSAILLVFYAQALGRYAKSAQRPSLSSAQPEASLTAKPARGAELYIPELAHKEDVTTIESSQLVLEIGKKSPTIHAIILKNQRDVLTGAPLKFGKTQPVLYVQPGNETQGWTLSNQTAAAAIWTNQDESVSVELDATHPSFSIQLRSGVDKHEFPVRIVSTWNRSDQVSGRYNLLQADLLTQRTGPLQRTHLKYMAGTRDPRSVPRGTSLVTLSERYFCESIKLQEGSIGRATLLPAEPGLVSVAIEDQARGGGYSIGVYAGPRDYFHLKDAGFQNAFPLGFLAKIGLLLLLILQGIAAVVKNYGVAIILLSAGVTVMLSPFTLMSLRSMKKMQQLQPRIDSLRKKHEKDPTKMNQEIFALFRENRVSPLSGCLPMLLQLPVFFALWSAISQVNEIRGAKFLWIADLSLPDRVAKLPIGFELNLLPILMAFAMYTQTKLSQRGMASTKETAMFQGPMMAILFGVMFYQVPSGLVLYWLTNSLSAIALYKLSNI